jgi:hypothetical protein
VWPLLFFHLFHSVSHHFSLSCFRCW